MPEKEKTVRCQDCVKARYCMSYVGGVDTILRRLGVMDFDLIVKSCVNFVEGGDKTRDSHVIMKDGVIYVNDTEKI